MSTAWQDSRTPESEYDASAPPSFDDHARVDMRRDPDTGLQTIIAVHDTTLGPALGGCRMWPYASEYEALDDVLRVAARS